jgi:Ca-activated chloride channel family protein
MDKVTFLHPGFFWLFLLLPLAIGWYIWKRRQQQAPLTVSSLQGFRAKPSVLSKLQPVLFAMRMLALSALIVALARPRSVDVSSRPSTVNGIDIVMAIDVSSSMLARDLKPDRLTALKKVAQGFIDARPADRIGLVVYAAESFTKIPVTSDKELVKQAVSTINYDSAVLQDGTGIGIGLATAVNRLKESKARSRVIILLTDGVNNAGMIDPRMAAEMAREFNIKVYTVGLGTNGIAEMPYARRPDGSIVYRNMKVEIDEELMKEIARTTQGRYFRATSNNSLKAIYDDINKLEKTKIEDLRYYNYDERFRPFLYVALGLLLIEILIRKTLLRSFI